jgi:hypothetical protein
MRNSIADRAPRISDIFTADINPDKLKLFKIEMEVYISYFDPAVQAFSGMAV